MTSPYKIYNRKFSPQALKQFRTLRGFTEYDMCLHVFAEKTHTYRYRQYEDGVRAPSLQTLLAICKILDCRIDDLAPKITEQAS